jgi:Plasmid pRiA4b ORF-3-like protein
MADQRVTHWLQLKTLLRDVHPAVWRRVRLSDSLSIAELHQVIQVLMGWEDDHLGIGLSIASSHHTSTCRSAGQERVCGLFHLGRGSHNFNRSTSAAALRWSRSLERNS